MSSKGKTPLLVASEFNCIPMVRLLLLNGADPNLGFGVKISKKSKNLGRTALMIAGERLVFLCMEEVSFLKILTSSQPRKAFWNVQRCCCSTVQTFCFQHSLVCQVCSVDSFKDSHLPALSLVKDAKAKKSKHGKSNQDKLRQLLEEVVCNCPYIFIEVSLCCLGRSKTSGCWNEATNRRCKRSRCCP